VLAIARVDVAPDGERFGSLVEVSKIGSSLRSSKRPRQRLDDQTGIEQAKHEHKKACPGGKCFQSMQFSPFDRSIRLTRSVTISFLTSDLVPPHHCSSAFGIDGLKVKSRE
jgi:hypothetical protein